MPNVSVIIPIYNAGKYIKETIKSVLEQTYSDFELLLIDDGSQDDSSKICQAVCKEDSRVKYFSQKNHGISYTRNKGINLAQGKYCAFCDNDDLLDQNLLADNIKLMQEKDADIVKFGRITHLKNHLYPTVFSHSDPFIVTRVNIDDEYQDLSNGPSLLYVWDGIFRKKFLTDNQIIFDEKFKSGEEDRNFMFDCLKFDPKIVVNPYCYYHHFIRQSGNTTGNYSANRVESIKISVRHEKSLLEFFRLNNTVYWNNQLMNYVELLLVELMKGVKELGMRNCLVQINDFVDEFGLRKINLRTLEKRRSKVILFLLKFHAEFLLYYGSVLKTYQKNRH